MYDVTMKDRDEKSPIETPELDHDEGTSDDVRGRSRGRRRTAREIAQMFEQLKLRHLQRKKEWQMEKEELQKQASLAEESKKILVDLKNILEELRIELREEEAKRTHAEEEHHRDQVTWEEEKNELLKIIKNMEVQRGISNSDIDSRLKMENHSLKSQVFARERDLAEMKIAMADLQKKLDERECWFKEEKCNILFMHEGEKRNWEKTRQVMLDKIESLREECNRRSTSTFPLHGCHVISSPVTDEQSPMTSLPSSRNEDSLSPEKKSTDSADRNENVVPEASAKYNHFQKTVDDALKQIEKISHDLNNIDVENESKRKVNKLRRLSVDPTTSQSPMHESFKSPSLDRSSANSRRHSFTSSILRRSVTPGRKMSSSSRDGVESSRSKSFAPTSSPLLVNPPDSKPLVTYTRTRKETKPSQLNSPVTSVSQNSNQLHEYGSDVSNKQTPDKLITTSKKLTTSTASASKANANLPFVKVEKSYKDTTKDKQAKKDVNATTSKLPNLHQKLLFRNSDTFQRSLTNKNYNATTKENKSHMLEETSDNSTPNLHTPYFNPETGYIKHSSKSPRLCRSTKISGNLVSSNSDENTNVQKVPNDFLSTQSLNINKVPEEVTEVDPPPVRPKPTITIEKDVKGNVLRVISDPRYQTSPGISPAPNLPNQTLTVVDNTERRRRSCEALSELIPQAVHSLQEELAFDSQLNDKSKESFSKIGKKWIKKRLSIKEPSSKDQSPDKKSSASKGKSRRAFLSRRKNDMLEGSTSEESVEDCNYKGKRKQTDYEKYETAAKPRMKRYTRSKTDGHLEMKGLLSKFKVSQFGSKKPTIVKQFEKKLLENEIKTLEDAQEKIKSSNEVPKKEMKVRDKVEDEGYSGEDEEDYIGEKTVSNNLPRTTSAISLLENSDNTPPKVLPKPKYHKSMIDLRNQDEQVVENKEPQNTTRVQKEDVTNLLNSSDSVRKTKPHYEYIRTSLSKIDPLDKGSSNSSLDRNSTPERPSVSNLVGKFSSQNFVRGGVGRHSLKQDERIQLRRNTEGSVRHRVTFEKPSQKRLSWSTPSPTGSNSIDEKNTWREKVIGPSSTGNDVIDKPRRKMSEDMLRKKANLENVLQGRSRPRRYRRAETQPIQSTRSSDDDVDNDIGEFWKTNNKINTNRPVSLANENFVQELSHDTVPDLTPRFKKPVMTNRRKPSRWKNQ